MTIIHPLDSLLDELFPEAKGDEQKLIAAARRFYAFGPFEPAVQVKGGQLIIEINIARIELTSSQKTGQHKSREKAGQLHTLTTRNCHEKK